MSQDFHRIATNDDFIIRCQELAPPRIQRLMRAEADFLRAEKSTTGGVLDVVGRER